MPIMIAPRSCSWMLGVAILFLSGCTISVQPASWMAKPTPPPLGPDGQPLPPGSIASKTGVPPNTPYPGQTYSTEQLAMYKQQLLNYEDEKKAMLARMQQMEIQAEKKNQEIQQTNLLVNDSSNQLKRTREELTRWRSEMDDLRTKVRTMDRENKSNLETILKALEQYIDQNQVKPNATNHGP